ncbi:MAG: hypothetical protein M3N08_05535 [Pseudomonadota bacterium]|nr:hypothetical protein [Pseudomonadota bacterium]
MPTKQTKLKYEHASMRPNPAPMNAQVRQAFEAYADELTNAGVDRIVVACTSRAEAALALTDQEFYVSLASKTVEQKADITIALQHVAAKLTDVTNVGFYVESGRSTMRGPYTAVRPRAAAAGLIKQPHTAPVKPN